MSLNSIDLAVTKIGTRRSSVSTGVWSSVVCRGVIGVVWRRALARVVVSVVKEVGRTPAIVGSMCRICRSRKVCRFILGSGYSCFIIQKFFMKLVKGDRSVELGWHEQVLYTHPQAHLGFSL